MEAGTIILLAICAVHESLHGTESLRTAVSLGLLTGIPMMCGSKGDKRPGLGGPARERHRRPGHHPRLPAGADASCPSNLCHLASFLLFFLDRHKQIYATRANFWCGAYVG
jgi:hypothetical protein